MTKMFDLVIRWMTMIFFLFRTLFLGLLLISLFCLPREAKNSQIDYKQNWTLLILWWHWVECSHLKRSAEYGFKLCVMFHFTNTSVVTSYKHKLCWVCSLSSLVLCLHMLYSSPRLPETERTEGCRHGKSVGFMWLHYKMKWSIPYFKSCLNT